MILCIRPTFQLKKIIILIGLTYEFHHHHHHHQVAQKVQISLTLYLYISLLTRLYHPSLPTGPPNYIQCPHRADVSMSLMRWFLLLQHWISVFELILLKLLGRNSRGVFEKVLDSILEVSSCSSERYYVHFRTHGKGNKTHNYKLNSITVLLRLGWPGH